MKCIVVCFSFVLSIAASADSVIRCKLSSASEQAMALAPKSFRIEESGPVTLVTDRGPLVSLQIGSGEAVYYGNQDFRVMLTTARSVVTHGMVKGTEEYFVKGCKDEEETEATHRFSYRLKGKSYSPGAASYQCECSLD